MWKGEALEACRWHREAECGWQVGPWMLPSTGW